MNTGPYCQRIDQPIQAGRPKAGSQRFHCKVCQRTYTPQPKPMGYGDEIDQRALQLVADGNNFRRVARQLGVNHQTVINWVNAAVAQLPPAPVPDTVEVIEMDELYTFVEQKNGVYVMTLVDRHTSCSLGWAVADSPTEAIVAALIDAAPQARFYYSHLLAV